MGLLYVTKSDSSIWNNFLMTGGDFFLIGLIKKKKIPRMQYFSKRILCMAVAQLLSSFQSWSKELRHLGYIFLRPLVPNVEEVWLPGKCSKSNPFDTGHSLLNVLISLYWVPYMGVVVCTCWH